MRPLVLLALLACSSPRSPDPALAARRRALAAALRFPGEGGALDPRWSSEVPIDGGRARSVSLLVRPGFQAAAVLMEPATVTPYAAVVAHGHYGDGKNSAEAADIGFALVRAGVSALLVDTPGVEEWAVPGRQIHFDEGAHNRALLASAGTSAMALQLAALGRGLDLLQSLGYQRFVATGASGGATQSFYLLLTDGRVEGAALASMPPVPREARPAGCACDQVPGWPGPDPGVLSMVDRPLLWMSEVDQARPEGLPEGADFVVMEGPHSYTPEMVRRATGWLGERLGWPVSEQQAGPAPTGLRTPGPEGGPWLSIRQLPLSKSARWIPTRRDGPPLSASCEGEGRGVLVAGGSAEDAAALRLAGLRPCLVKLLDDSSVDQAEAIARQRPWADALGGSLATLGAQMKAELVWAVRAWALPAAASGLPFVVEDPVTRLDQVDFERDPAWIHVPGAWQGAAADAVARARAVGQDREALAGVINGM